MRTANEQIILDLQELIKTIERKINPLKKAVTEYKKKDITNYFDIYKWLVTFEDILTQEFPGIAETIIQIKSICDDSILKLESEMKDNFEKRGFTFNGQWPNYYIDFILPLIIDENKFNIFVGDVNTGIINMKLVNETVSDQIKKMKPNETKLKEFLKVLFEAFKKITYSDESVSIQDVYREIVLFMQKKNFWVDAKDSNFTQFTRNEFRAYITGLLLHNLTSIQDYNIRLLPPVSKEDSLFIYQPAEKRFCLAGRIQFIKSGGQG